MRRDLQAGPPWRAGGSLFWCGPLLVSALMACLLQLWRAHACQGRGRTAVLGAAMAPEASRVNAEWDAEASKELPLKFDSANAKSLAQKIGKERCASCQP
eukprot:6489046-Amphidinium_carterae.1